MTKGREWEADVVIIGGGITGASIARELSRYKIETVLVEKGGELAAGQTKASFSHMDTGLNMAQSLITKSTVLSPGTSLLDLYHPNTLKMKWNDEGFKEWGPVLKQLDIKHKYTSVLIVAKDEHQIKQLDIIRDLSMQIGGVYADFTELDREGILELEPYVNKTVVKGLYADGSVIDIFPADVAIAVAENAVQNGVKIKLNTDVTDISPGAGCQILKTTKGSIKTKFIVNAAGGWCDKVADMGGVRNWGLQYRKAHMIVLDKSKGFLVRHGIVRFPSEPGLIQALDRRLEGNLVLIFGTYAETDKPNDVCTSRKELTTGIAMAKELIPSISEKDVINSFAGVRVFNTRDSDDHIVEFAANNPKFLNVVIRLPGLTGALPMSRYVVRMLADAGLGLVTKSDFNPYRKGIPRFHDLPDDERRKLIQKDPRYGHVVCRCETVTEGEIVEAVKRGAIGEEGIRMRTRAGMGRCKGGFCRPRVIQILARELGIPITKVTMKSEKSPFMLYKTNELLEGK